MSDKNKYRLAHTMTRVTNLEKSLDFYTRLLGMSILRQKEYPDGKFTNTFVGYGRPKIQTLQSHLLEQTSRCTNHLSDYSTLIRVNRFNYIDRSCCKFSFSMR